MGPARILVIDDSTTDIYLLEIALNEQGEEYELEILSDGEAALQFVREHRSGVRKREPCVILLDLYLPDHNGLAVLHAIKEAPELTHINVVVLTGSASPRDRAEVQGLGARFWQKPRELSEFNDLAQEILAICRDALATSA
jgi:CheY-like chemotaxis protein